MNQNFLRRIVNVVKIRNVLFPLKYRSISKVAHLIGLPIIFKIPYRCQIGFAIPIVYAATSTKETSVPNVDKLIAESDELYSTFQYKESYEVLVSLKDTNDPQVYWRLCRGLYNWSRNSDATAEEKKKLIIEADKYIQKAISFDDHHYAIHMWKAILLDATAELEGTKARIASLPSFQHHVLRAIELNPEYPTLYHMMGTFHYGLSDCPWYQKKIASALFGAVPPSSFEEALSFFKKAEELQPNFYSTNLLMLGKTYHKLGFQDSAREWLQRAANFEANTEEEKQVKKEALDLLRKLKS